MEKYKCKKCGHKFSRKQWVSTLFTVDCDEEETSPTIYAHINTPVPLACSQCKTPTIGYNRIRNWINDVIENNK